MTQTAILDCDLDLLGAERPEIDGFEDHGLFRRLGDPRLVWSAARRLRFLVRGCL